MAKLTEAVQRHIVQALACYDTPTQVADAVTEEFGVTLTRQHIAKYDPTKANGAKLSKKWRDVFESTRKRFREEISEIPIAGQAYRLRTLQHALCMAERRGNIVLSAQLLEQAAKEVGGVFTNSKRHELAGPNGGPIPLMPTTVELVAPGLMETWSESACRPAECYVWFTRGRRIDEQGGHAIPRAVAFYLAFRAAHPQIRCRRRTC